MRTLDEIVSAARAGEKPSVDELRYAVCAMDHLLTFDRSAFMRLAQAEREGKKPFLTTSAVWQWEECFRRQKAALAKSPKDWLGPDHDPDSAEVQKRRVIANKIMDKVMRASDRETEVRRCSDDWTKGL